MIFIGDLEPYRKEIAGKRKKQYQRLLEQADRYKTMVLPEEHPKESTTYMGIAIPNLALAYCLSGDEEYLHQAKRFIRTVLSYEKWGNAHLVNVDLSASWILFGLSLGYDWLKPWLSPEEQSKISAKIRHHAQIMLDYRRETHGKGWSTNFYQNHNWINMTGLAAAGYALQGEDEAAAQYIQEAKEDFARVFALMPEDGSNYEGATYWRYGGMWLFVYAHLLKVQESVDWFQKSEYLKNTFYYRLYQSCADLKRQLNYGDCHDRYSSHTACVYYKVAAEYGDGYAQKLGNLVVDEFLMEEAQNSKVKPGILPEAVFEFLWYAPDVPEKDLSNLPLVRYFDDLGLLTVRSSWKRDAKVLTIKCSPPGGIKQWREGWKIRNEEGIELFSLSHHHPDNLSYIFTRGSDYFTCEDGYNRNLMPDNHTVLLVDGLYTDAVDVNDAYMSSVRQRLVAGEPFCPEQYAGRVTKFQTEGSLVLYRGETAGVYPAKQEMQEVSRALITDGLRFWVFVDLLRSTQSHTYSLICNTDRRAQLDGQTAVYPLMGGELSYQVYSDRPVCQKQYQQQVESVMTTQEQDKKCRTEIQTLATCSSAPEKEQVFFECFTFSDDPVKVQHTGRSLFLECGGCSYEVKVGYCDSASNTTPIQVVCQSKTKQEYSL